MQQPLPENPQGTTAVYEDFFANVLPYNINNIHPRFWAWVQGGGSPFGMLADMLVSGMNANVSLGDSMPMYAGKAGARLVEGNDGFSGNGQWPVADGASWLTLPR